MAGDELVDEVDVDDRVVATVTRAEMRARRLRHRSVAVAVVSSTGELLVHRRSEHKDLWPDMWDVAIGGVVAAGEPYDDAAARELAEEVGIVEPMAPLGRGRYEDGDVAEILACYRVVHDGPFAFADGEVIEARWVTPAALEVLQSHARFVPDTTAVLMPLLRWG